MPLTARDLDEIRRIVREELARALPAKATEALDATSEADASEPPSDPEMRRLVNETRALLARKSAEREARPIPDGPFVDRYDASRLLRVTENTVTRYISSGRLTRRMVKGRIEVSRAEIDALLSQRSRK